MEKYLSRYTDRLITINDEDYARAVKFPIRGKVEKISGVGIYLDKFKEYKKKNWEIYAPDIKIEQTAENNIRIRYGIPSDYRIMVSVGELTSGKKIWLHLKHWRK